MSPCGWACATTGARPIWAVYSTWPPEIVLTPREAFSADVETVSLRTSASRIAAEPITPYPPGIPLVMPGERLTAEIVDVLDGLRGAGNPISAADPTLERVTVVR